ncbi:MAG: copper transport protein [Actinomycetota bacterium]|jgi:copper transport protein|nr:copper transport protein [Actinomycetota bacterium]
MGFEETFRDIAFTCVRFLAFSAHAFLFGAPVVILLVLRPAFAALDPESWAEGRARLASRLEGVVQSAFVASAIATAMAIALQAVLVAELNDGDLSSPSFMSVFSNTFGQWHLFRYPLLAGLLVLLSGKVRQWSLQSEGGAARSWWAGWLLLAMGLLATHSFTGHAAVSSPRALGLLNDMVHLAFGSVWFAGIVILAVLLPDAWRRKDDAERLDLLGPVVSRFSKVALVSITIVAITGTLNALLDVAHLNDMIDSPYGITLTVKIVFFLGILALGGINHFFLTKRLEAGARDPRAGSAQRFFRMTIAFELAIAITIMGVTGWLTGQAKTKQAELPTGSPISSGSTP